MELHEQHCWELKGGQLVPADDPVSGDGGVDEQLYAVGYLCEITSKCGDSFGAADVTVYKNTSPTKTNPLFYIDVMGNNTGIAALIARDFKQLAETLNFLSGLLSLIRMDQSFAISNFMVRSSMPMP